ncbi:MAG: hypothetical protein A2W23_03105 [Planctomycetes bacterium RBG_16_43_13]|nr:MAG: hypothetical protein A2W23_03105 [Planctomycetes bacterium RBG_16_43_13]
MDGYTLLRELRVLLGEPSNGSFLDDRTSYDCLYEAAKELCQRTRALTSAQTITTVAEQTTYNLNPDFLSLYLSDNENDYVIKYNDGSSNTFLRHRDYDGIILGDNTTSQTVPDSFTIIDASGISQLSGSTTNTSGSSNGETTLTDSSANFINVAAGDYVHNLTDGSHGVVVSKTSSTALVCALFDGANNYWVYGNSYIITFNGRFALLLDPPPSTASHTITVNYIQMPTPVYSPYKSYRFAPDYKEALIYYAAFKYKYRDREPDFGDRLWKHFDARVRSITRDTRQAKVQGGYRVNLIKPANRSGTRR